MSNTITQDSLHHDNSRLGGSGASDSDQYEESSNIAQTEASTLIMNSTHKSGFNLKQ
jgi:hypothetical protein